MRSLATVATIPMLGVLCLAAAAGGSEQRSQPAQGSLSIRDIESGETKVATIRFTHVRTKPFKNGDLRAAMTTAEGDIFQRRFFRNDMVTLEGIYRGKGYMDGDILSKRFSIDERGRLHISLTIDSGALWHLDGIEVRFAETDLDTATIVERFEIKAGQVFSYNAILAEERQLLADLNGRGYPHARVTNRLELNANRKTAAVEYDVDPGRRMYFGDITIESGDATRGVMMTKPGLVASKLTFRQGGLYDPEQLRRTRNNLARTNLFRSVTISTPAGAARDSLQPVVIRLQERKFIHLEALAFFNNAEPGLSSNVQHSNWLGRGTRIGMDGELGRPLQGATIYWTQPNILQTGADLTLSAGLTDEWGDRQVFANPEDSLQFELLTSNHSVLNDLLAAEELGFGDLLSLAPAEFIAVSFYDYASVKRLRQVNGSLTRRWENGRGGDESYQASVSLTWIDSRNRPVSGGFIRLNTPDEEVTIDSTGSGDDGGLFDDDPFGDSDPFGDGDPFGDEDPFGDKVPAQETDAGFVDYADGRIPTDRVWRRLLTDRARTLNLNLELQRDTRNNQITPSRGTFVRIAGLYALQFGGQSTRVLDGQMEARSYLPIGDHLVWANASQAALTASLRQDRPLPQDYWQEFGGEGSVRGVKRNSIQAVGGGRAGLLFRSELRFQSGKAGVVAFWDRAGVWHHTGEAAWSKMTDGYGVGVRYDTGIPFRLDYGWSNGFGERRIYFSIGQAF